MGNVIPSWQKRYPFSVRNLTAASINMKLALYARDERSLNFIQVSDPVRIHKLAADFDVSQEAYCDLYEFKLTPGSIERIILVFSCNEPHDESLYHDVWMRISPLWGKSRKSLRISPLQETIT